VRINVQLEREMKDDELWAVDAPRFPKRKDEGWWLVVGAPKLNQLFAIKRVALYKRAKVKLEFTAGFCGWFTGLFDWFVQVSRDDSVLYVRLVLGV